MPRFLENKKKIWRWSLIITAVIFVYLLLFVKKPVEVQPRWGVSFSAMQATDLGLVWPEVYGALLDDLGARYFRLAVPWNQLEPRPGEFDWSVLDWQLAELAKRQGKAILAVGEKTPRWPECHFTDWMWKLGEKERQAKVLVMLEKIVKRYKDHPALYRWQVENERLFPFGVCHKGKFSFLRQELNLVRQLDPNHQVMTSDSGELSTWLAAAAISDVLPISMYRVVWNKVFGYFFWPLTPSLYFYHANALSFLVPEVIISELQAEPWSNQPLVKTPLSQQAKSMNEKIFEKNLAFARETGFAEIYLWGAEWWYWMKKNQNQPYYWESVKKLFNK